MFGQIAPRYDLLNHLLSLNIDRSWRRKTVDRLRVNGTAPILDVCTGTGDLAMEIRRRFGSQTPVIGSDFCHEMLAIGVEKSKRDRNAHVNYVEAD